MKKVQVQDESLVLLAEPQFKLYFRRWLVLFSFSLFSFANPFGAIEYSPILRICANYYHQQEDNLLWLPNSYTLSYLILALFSIYPLQERLDYSLFVANFLNALGYLMKWFGKDNYLWQILGVQFLGIAQLFVLAAPACNVYFYTQNIVISDRWFGVYERNLATSIASYGNILGDTFSFLFPVLYFKDITDEEEIGRRIQIMNLMIFILSAFAFLMSLMCIRNKPETPPSFSSTEVKMNILQSLKKILNSWKQFFNMLSLCVYLGINWTYTNAISIILEPHNYSQNEIGVVGLVYTISGIIAGIIGSMYIDLQIKKNQSPQYDLLIKGFCTLGIAALFAQAYFVENFGIEINIALSALIGIGFNAYFPIAFQSYLETNYPCSELTLTTTLMVVANGFCYIGTELMLIPVFSGYELYVLGCLALPFFIYLIQFYKTEFKRLQAEFDNSSIYQTK